MDPVRIIQAEAHLLEVDMTEVLYGRPNHQKIFLSSKMADGALREEREVAYKAIKSTRLAKAWAWEWDTQAGPYSAEAICLGEARTSDGLVLILAEELTEMTRKEYEAADANGVPCYILVKENVTQSDEVKKFINKERGNGSITRKFRNLSELRTEITRAIVGFSTYLLRSHIARQRQERAKGRR